MTEPKRGPGRPPGSKNKAKPNSPGSAAAHGRSRRQIEGYNRITDSRLRTEIVAIALVVLGLFLIIALQTTAAGQIGKGLAVLLKGLFGHVAFIAPYLFLIYGVLLLIGRTSRISMRSVIFLFVCLLSLATLNSARFLKLDPAFKWTRGWLRTTYQNGSDLSGGGAIGMNLGYVLTKAIGHYGLYLLCGSVLLISLLLLFNTPLAKYFDAFRQRKALHREKKAAAQTTAEDKPVADGEFFAPSSMAAAAADMSPKSNPNYVSPFVDPETGLRPKQAKIVDYMRDEAWESDDESSDDQETVSSIETLSETHPEEQSEVHAAAPAKSKSEADPAAETIVPAETPDIPYKLPPIELLAKSPVDSKRHDTTNLQAQAIKLEQTLQNFGVSAKVLQVIKGPAVTRYEIQPDVGVKVNSIVRLADDIALNLEAKSIRMEAPIPGKAAVGIEVENDRINLVTAREIIASEEFNRAKSRISFALGKDISGRPIVADLKDMPHLLIAGSTGSGKSVCLNTMIVSLLYRAKPDEVKLVLIDPKVVELGNYNGIPHLLIPVVTEPTKAAAALNWAVAEMTERYKKFAAAGVRDLEAYNEEMHKVGESDQQMPQIIIIIDELADLMMAAPNQVEESICRLAQMARAAGMHLIVATQRPSVDVITGLIKANIPSRISFAVSSQFDSRTILDMAGAEKLFSPIGMAKPLRVQGAFISDTEVHKVIEFLKKQMPDQEYSADVLTRIERTVDPPDDDSDELLQAAIETVVRAEQASVSMLQRRFRIGYNRAARLVDMMEARGIIGPSDGSRPRKVLLTEEELIRLGRADDDEYDDIDD
jgi:S-DNA-T family DNA segregation ATPase FtsK/SpoIIIE